MLSNKTKEKKRWSIMKREEKRDGTLALVDKYFLLVPFQVWMEKIAAKGSQEGLSTSSK